MTIRVVLVRMMKVSGSDEGEHKGSVSEDDEGDHKGSVSEGDEGGRKGSVSEDDEGGRKARVVPRATSQRRRGHVTP